MGLKIVAQPSVEPVTLADAKLHLRVDHDTEDDLISAMIAAAREACEHETDRAIAVQTLELAIDAFPADGIKLLRPPVASIESVVYVDAEGVEQTMPSTSYYLDSAQEPSWLLPAVGADWPATREQANAVRVRYVAGYTECPKAIRAWILLRLGTLYRTREGDSEKPVVASPFADRMLDRYRVWVK